jgi:hypothetical protein
MVQSVKPTIGKYTLGERVHLGGPGEVYRALHRREHVAVRFLPTTLAADPNFADRFEREMGRLAELDHPQIVPVLAFGQQDGVPYVVTPLEFGETLRERFARNRPLPEELLGYMRQIAAALDDAHGRGIVHGDLQPNNILITDDESVLVASFGLAGLCAPEGQDVEHAFRDDVAALARIAESGLTGGLSPTALAGATNRGLPIIRRALAKEYTSAGDFVRDLARAQSGTVEAITPTVAQPAKEKPASEARAPRQVSRLRLPQALVPQSAAGRRVALMWVAGFVLAAVVVGGAIAALGGRDRDTSVGAVVPSPATSEAPAGKAAASVVPTGDLPYYFPVENALIARRYAEAQGRLPAEATDGKLHRFAAECADPRSGADCLLVYVFYSKQADQMYNYHYKILEDALVGDFVEPAQNDDYRITFEQLPWEKNPEWARLVRESFAQLPVDYAPGGFSAGLVGNAAASNNGVADWAIVYVEREPNKQIIFELLGDKLTKLPE